MNLKKQWILVAWIFVEGAFFTAIAKEPQPEAQKSCYASREYITTLRYLRQHDEFKIPEPQAQSIADWVSQNCDGAAKRFIQVNNLLIRSGVSTTQALRKAMEFAAATPKQVEVYIELFRKAYLREGLDLDLATSTKLAEDLSLYFNGDPKNALSDFQLLSEACLESDGFE